MIRRDTFRRLAASLAAPALIGAATLQRGASAAAYKVGDLSIKTYDGWSQAFVWNGRAWIIVTPNGPGWRALIARFRKEELEQIAIKADGVGRWASEFVK